MEKKLNQHFKENLQLELRIKSEMEMHIKQFKLFDQRLQACEQTVNKFVVTVEKKVESININIAKLSVQREPQIQKDKEFDAKLPENLIVNKNTRRPHAKFEHEQELKDITLTNQLLMIKNNLLKYRIE